MLRKHVLIKTVNDEFKNISQLEPTRHPVGGELFHECFGCGRSLTLVSPHPH